MRPRLDVLQDPFGTPASFFSSRYLYDCFSLDVKGPERIRARYGASEEFELEKLQGRLAQERWLLMLGWGREGAQFQVSLRLTYGREPKAAQISSS